MRHNVADRVSAGTDIIDSRDVLERIGELESELSAVDCTYCDGTGRILAPDGDESGDECSYCDGDGTVDLAGIILDKDCPNTHTAPHADEYGEQMDELRLLRKLVEDIDNNAGDSARDGVGLIADHYFERYAQEFADDIDAINADAVWPVCYIDWEAAAEALKMDYSSIEYGGTTYWVRS